MKLFKLFLNKLKHNTLLGKTYEMFESLVYYIKDYLYISDTLYSDGFKVVIKKYLNVNIKKDWIGRLYGVINPNIDINGNFNINNMIIEIDGDNTNDNEYVKHWIYKQLTLIGQLFKIEKLYDYINLTFKHVGPEEADNYLLVFDIVSRKAFAHACKRFFIHFSIYAIIFGICWLVYSILL